MRNERTGELIGHIGDLGESQQTITLAGRTHRIIRHDDELVVAPLPDRAGDADDTPNYGGKRRPISESFAAHVRRGCGLDEMHAPLVHTAQGAVWFHFGGEPFSAILRAVFPQFTSGVAMAGIALWVVDGFDAVSLSVSDLRAVREIVIAAGSRLAADNELGRFATELPSAAAAAFLAEYSLPERFMQWLSSRIVTEAERPHAASFGKVIALAIARGRAGQ